MGESVAQFYYSLKAGLRALLRVEAVPSAQLFRIRHNGDLAGKIQAFRQVDGLVTAPATGENSLGFLDVVACLALP